MRLSLEVAGGFTGKAGKQTIDVDTAHLAESKADPIARDLERLPDDTWGKRFVSPHPKPWDFLHVLRVDDGGRERSVTFHLNEGPAELSHLAEQLTALGSNEP